MIYKAVEETAISSGARRGGVRAGPCRRYGVAPI
jgi:hypothetical protein